MKNYLSILFIATLLLSCTKDETQKITELNCDCDRVVEVNTFNVIGTPANPAIVYYSNYTTINDCTKIQREKSSSTTSSNLRPKIGDCK